MRKADELPWQFRQAKSWERLKGCITNLDILLKLMTEEKKYELMGYWLSMDDKFDMVKEYNNSIEKYEQIEPSEKSFADMLYEVSLFFI